MQAMDRDDVVHFPIDDLPRVISPAKPRSTQTEDATSQVNEGIVSIQMIYLSRCIEVEKGVPTRRRAGLRTRSNRTIVTDDAAFGEENAKRAGVSDDGDDYEDSDYDMVDFGYHITEGDDDLYAYNVDEDVEKDMNKGKEKLENDCASEDDDFWAPNDVGVPFGCATIKIYGVQISHGPRDKAKEKAHTEGNNQR